MTKQALVIPIVVLTAIALFMHDGQKIKQQVHQRQTELRAYALRQSEVGIKHVIIPNDISVVPRQERNTHNARFTCKLYAGDMITRLEYHKGDSIYYLEESSGKPGACPIGAEFFIDDDLIDYWRQSYGQLGKDI